MGQGAGSYLSLIEKTLQEAAIGIYWADAEGVIKYANKAVSQLLHYNTDDLVGRRIPDINPEFSRKAYRKLFDSLQIERGEMLETEQVTADDQEIEVKIRVFLVEADGEQLCCHLLLGKGGVPSGSVPEHQEDIKFSGIFQYANDAILILDADTRQIVDANPKAFDLLGYETSVLITTHIKELLPQQERMVDAFLGKVQESMTGQTNQFIFETNQGGQIAADLSASYFKVHDREGILLILQPFSDQQHIERILGQIVEGALSERSMEFVPNFVRQVAQVLNVKAAGISRAADNSLTKLNVLALWNVNQFEEPFEYGVEDTPCQVVLQKKNCFIAADVQKRFPKDGFLKRLGAESYLAVPVYDPNRKPVGHFFIVDDKPMELRPWVESLLKIGATRMGMEVEKKRVEDELKLRLEVEGLISDISGRFINVDADTIDATIRWALEKIGNHVKATRSYIIGVSEDMNTAFTTYEWSHTQARSLKNYFQNITRKEYPWPFELLDQQQLLFISDIHEVGEEAGAFRDILMKFNIQTTLNVPMVCQGQTYGFLGFDAETKKDWSLNDIVLLKLTSEVIVNSIERVKFEKYLQELNENLERQVDERTREIKRANEELARALSEVEELRDKLEAENIYLKEESDLSSNFENIITTDPNYKRILKEIEQVANTSSTVLITGETGTGKEVVATALHNHSQRKDKPFIKINCAALPATLIESELFGHEKGAFTGAAGLKQGRFELADSGTLFLDEVGEIPLELQSKLLRALQEGEFERLGGTKTIKVDVRVIAATNRNLEKGIEEGKFRSDLYYRLNVFPITLPPLRDRKGDIPVLINHFVNRYNPKLGKQITKIPNKVVSELTQYDWPGNIRELENIIERAIIVSQGNQLRLGDWFVGSHKREGNGKAETYETLEQVEREYILKVLEETSGQVSGPQGAAKILGLKPTTLQSRMKKLGIK